MHSTSVASLLISALCLFGHAAGKDAPTSQELIQELTQLPQCAVCSLTMARLCFTPRITDEADFSPRLLASRQRSLLRRASLATLLAYAAMRHTQRLLGPASCPAVLIRAQYVCVSSVSLNISTHTDCQSATQGWQKRACQAPVRDAGPMSRHVNIALLVIATIFISIRFLARWRIQGSTLGWDDWTILASYILLIPSTAILQLSSLPLKLYSLDCADFRP
jgi:hypothetical protein